ncbi:MAG: MMPL family transporter [Planctomycetota bacterium]
MHYVAWLEHKLGDWGAYSARHRWRILIVTALLTLVSLPPAYQAISNLDVNLFNQASDSLKRFKLMRELSEDFGGDILAAVITIPDGSSAAQIKELKAFGALLSAELSKVGTTSEDKADLPEHILREINQTCGNISASADGTGRAETISESPAWLRHVECRIGQGLEQSLKKLARQYPHIALSPADVETLKKLFEPTKLAATMRQIAADIEDLPPTSTERARLQEDPLRVADLGKNVLRERLAHQRQTLGMTDAEGYFLSPDKTTLVILSRAILPAIRLDFNRALMAAAQRAENRAITAFRATQPTLSTALKSAIYGQFAAGEQISALTVGFTGMPAVSVENEMSLKYDLVSNVITAFVGVLILFLVVFRLIRLAWDVTWTTVIVIVWTLAIAGLTRGSISVLGGAFACILLGTGTDYAIHLHNGFHLCREVEGLSIEESLRRTLARCGPGIITAALTSSLAFLGVGFTRFSGLAEFGFLAGMSILFGALMMLMVFPALLARPTLRKQKTTEARGLGLPTWGRWLEIPSVRMASLVAGVCVIVGGILFIKFGPDPGPENVAGVRFDAEFGNLRSLKIQAIPLRNRLTERFGLGLADLRVVVEATDEAQAYAGAEEVVKRLQPFLDQGQLTPGGNVLDFIPSPRQQQATIAALKQFDFAVAANAFQTAATEQFGARGVVFFKPFLRRWQDFQQAVNRSNILTLSTIMQGPLSSVLAPFIKLDQATAPQSNESNRRVRLVSSWFPMGTQTPGIQTSACSPLGLPPSWYDSVTQALETEPPPGVKIRVTAARMVGFEMKDSLLRDCGWISLLVGVCVALALFAAFRSVSTSLLAVIPLVYAYITLLTGVAFCQWMQWEFSLNFVNLIMFPLLLGSGIDVGIYMVYEARSARRPRIAHLMTDTGRSVLCCTLTTLVGFGAFFWSSYTGLISLGVAAFFGYSGALFGALVVLPALLGVMRERKDS